MAEVRVRGPVTKSPGTALGSRPVLAVVCLGVLALLAEFVPSLAEVRLSTRPTNGAAAEVPLNSAV